MSQTVGRNEELKHLLQAYERTKHSGAKPPRPTQEFVLIHGNSGTGKTALASYLAATLRQDGGYLLVGKFNLTSAPQVPYAAFLQQLNQFTDELLGVGEQQPLEGLRLSFIRKAIRAAVGNEGRLLVNFMPSLERLMGPQEDNPPQVEVERDLNHFSAVFCKVCRAISLIVPLVLFLDDLQWSDKVSLDLIQTFLQSPLDAASYSNSSLLIVGAYSDGDAGGITKGSIVDDAQGSEVITATFSSPSLDDSSHINAEELPELPLSSSLRLWKKLASKGSLRLTEIIVADLDEIWSNALVAGVLEQPTDVVAALGGPIFSACKGNPFRTVTLVRLLIDQQVVQRNDDNDRWLWEFEAVVKAISSTETFHEIERQKLETLPQLSLDVLRLSALMGEDVDMSAILTYFNATDIGRLELAVQAAARDGHLTFERQQDRYAFLNDSIRQTVLSTIDDVDELSFKIGYKLWKQSATGFLSTKLGVVATMLNHGIQRLTDQAERYKAASLNLEAGVKAMSTACFQDANRYLDAGIAFLKGGDYWNEEYKLSLSLFSAAADAHASSQNYERVSDLASTVFQHAATLEDTLAAHTANIIATGQHGSVRLAAEEGFRVLRALGEHLPQRCSSLAIETKSFKVKAVLSWKSNEALLMLPPMQYEQKIAATHLMSMVLPYVYQASPNCFAVIGTNLVRSCLRFGIHKDSAVGFVAFGIALCCTNRKEGYRLGTLALTMVERMRAPELMPRVHLFFYGMIYHWKHPLKQSFDFLENVERVGMEIGDIEYAIFALSFRCNHAFGSGMPLPQLEDLLLDATQRMQLLKQRNMLMISSPLLQYIHNVTGRAPDPKMLSGDIVRLYDPNETVDNIFVPFAHHFYGADLAFMFGDHDLAAQMLERKRTLKVGPLGCYVAALDCFKEALISIAQARLANERCKNIRVAKRSWKQLKSWAKDCTPNFLNKQRLLEAELKAFRPHRQAKKRVLALYDEAIDLSLREEFIHEAALACELAGNYLSTHGDRPQATEHWERASGFYQRWGATEKATQLSMRVRHVSLRV